MVCVCALSSLSDVCSLFCDSQLQRNQLSVKEVDMGSIFGSIENVNVAYLSTLRNKSVQCSKSKSWFELRSRYKRSGSVKVFIAGCTIFKWIVSFLWNLLEGINYYFGHGIWKFDYKVFQYFLSIFAILQLAMPISAI